MLRTFLIIWTVVAGVAAAGLMYIVGWRPQTTMVAERLTSSSEAGASATASPVRPDNAPDSAAVPSGGSATRSATAPGATRSNSAPEASRTDTPGATPNSTAMAEGPANTGSLASAKPTRTVRRVDSSPALAERKPEGLKAAAISTSAEPPEVTPESAAGAVQKTASTAQDEPRMTDRRARIGSRQSGEGQEPSTSSGPNVATAPLSLPLSSEPESKRAKAKRELAARPAREVAAAEPEPESVAPRVSDRTLKQRASAARSAERRRAERTRAAEVQHPARSTSRPASSNRRQARRSERTRVARSGGSLESLMDDFSRSGADFMYERTTRVGSRYLVERTTRHGTQYFYEQRAR